MYLFVIADEISRFPFCYSNSNVNSETIIKCLNHLFALCGIPSCVYSDNARNFLSREIKDFFTGLGIASGNCFIYQSTGNSQVKGYNGVIWQSVWQSNLKIYRLNARSLYCQMFTFAPVFVEYCDQCLTSRIIFQFS